MILNPQSAAHMLLQIFMEFRKLEEKTRFIIYVSIVCDVAIRHAIAVQNQGHMPYVAYLIPLIQIELFVAAKWRPYADLLFLVDCID